jgi:hypothetical protein
MELTKNQFMHMLRSGYRLKRQNVLFWYDYEHTLEAYESEDHIPGFMCTDTSMRAPQLISGYWYMFDREHTTTFTVVKYPALYRRTTCK